MEIENQSLNILAPEGSLASVRRRFGTLIVDTARVVLHRNYSGLGDRFLINTTAEGIRGPRTGRASEDSVEGSAFIDLALTPESARLVYQQLGQALEEYKRAK